MKRYFVGKPNAFVGLLVQYLLKLTKLSFKFQLFFSILLKKYTFELFNFEIVIDNGLI